MNATEEYCYVALFIMLSKTQLTCKSVDQTLVCSRALESNLLIIAFIYNAKCRTTCQGATN